MTRTIPKLPAAARTNVGLKRSNNEDAYFLDEDLGLFLVADGMGGAASGEVASEMVSKAIADYVRRYVEEDIEFGDRYGFYDARLTTRANTLMQAIHLANSLVYDAAHHEKQHKGMGATLAALMTDEDHVLVVNVGDSRIYRCRDARLDRLTVDHRMTDDPKMRGVFEQGASIVNEMGNVLTRAMGVHQVVEPDLTRHPLRSGDSFLICSDGLSDMVEDEMIGRIMAMERSLDQKAKDLVDLALAGGGYDNVTVVLAGYETQGRLKRVLHIITKNN